MPIGYTQTNASGSFLKSSSGLIAGYAQDNPVKNQWDDGVFSGATPIWGGLPIKKLISSNSGLKGTITKAAAYADVNGWAIFNGASHLINEGNSIGLYRDGFTVHYLPTGSGARIAVEIDSTLAATLAASGVVGAQVSWDFTNNKIVTFSTTEIPVTIESISLVANNNLVVSYNSTDKTATQVTGTTTAVAVIII